MEWTNYCTKILTNIKMYPTAENKPPGNVWGTGLTKAKEETLSELDRGV